MRCLLLADDCGFSPGGTAVILRCLDTGRLRGTSLLPGTPYLRQAAKALKKRLTVLPWLRIGLHLNLLEGRCTASAADVPLLAGRDGRFKLNLGSLWAALTLSSRSMKRHLLAQIALEWRAQAALIRETVGVAAPLYLDGHLHVHVLPPLRPLVLELAEGLRAIHVRVPLEPAYALPGPFSLQVTGMLRRELLARWSAPLGVMLRKRGIAAPDLFIGAFCSGGMTLPRLKAGLDQARRIGPEDALVEVMLHPGGFSDEERARPDPELPYSAFYASPNRAIEAAMLLSPEFDQLMAGYDPGWTADAAAALRASGPGGEEGNA